MDLDIGLLCVDSDECSEGPTSEYKLCWDLRYNFYVLR